ncbi:Site-specific DNA recombinase [Shimia gijangensis]|uniref:Site-specific DNA recombinase n=1 Tax=Shimia gijangensis TaxID=1470563 RepID=A0A1M6SII7_9RHOB|nr:recombinase family protein [Shimia gijangensis]SHK44480.1 Site-specific DNA recombinase [Shimia gijangensis]
MRAAIYARFSTDLQSDASIEDQQRLCLRLIERKDWRAADTYSDRGISGSSHLRPAYQRLLEDARHNVFDVVVAEGLDRISRDQEHIAAFFKQMRFQGIPIVTMAEGEISELHIGLKGTMSSLFLKDLAQKTHRGLEGRIRKGKSAGGITYGYDVVRNFQADGEVSTGERIINAEQANVVRRIFEDYANDLSPRAIATQLNKESVEGPRDAGWGASTIYGNWRRGTGILNNELYIGRIVWNRQRYVKDPNSGKRQARMNPAEEWVIEEVPDLRITDQDLWEAVKSRQLDTRSTAISDGIKKLGRTKRARHLFSGMIKCGCCGGGFIQVGKQYYGCSSLRNKGTCDNRLTVKREDLETRVLSGLKDQLLHADLIAEFVRAYQEEYNQLAGAIKRDRSKAERDLIKVTKQIDRIIEAIAEGMFHPSMKDKVTELEAQKARLENDLRSSERDTPVLLHPGLADVYKEHVANLTEALNDPSAKAEATSIIRGLLSEIRLIPEGDALAIELVGELAGLLALGMSQNEESHPKVACSTVMVAGGRYQRYLLQLTLSRV